MKPICWVLGGTTLVLGILLGIGCMIVYYPPTSVSPTPIRTQIQPPKPSLPDLTWINESPGRQDPSYSEHCNIAQGDDECLAAGSFGQIIGTMDASRMSGVLTAQNAHNQQTKIDTPFGFDKVIQLDSDRYFVVATNRENAPTISFEKVYMIDFSSTTPTIREVISTPGYGGFDGSQNWLYIPAVETYTDLSLRSDLGSYSSSEQKPFIFGKMLLQMPGFDSKHWFINTAKVLNEDEIMIEFTKVGIPRGEYIARYIISFSKQKIYTVQ